MGSAHANGKYRLGELHLMKSGLNFSPLESHRLDKASLFLGGGDAVLAGTGKSTLVMPVLIHDSNGLACTRTILDCHD